MSIHFWILLEFFNTEDHDNGLLMLIKYTKFDLMKKLVGEINVILTNSMNTAYRYKYYLRTYNSSRKRTMSMDFIS